MHEYQTYIYTTVIIATATLTYFYLPIFKIEGEEGRKTPHQYISYKFLDTGKNMPPKKVSPSSSSSSLEHNSSSLEHEPVVAPGETSSSTLKTFGKILDRLIPRFFKKKTDKETQTDFPESSIEKHLDEFEKLQGEAFDIIKVRLENAEGYWYQKEILFQLIKLNSIQKELHEKQIPIDLPHLKEILPEGIYHSIERRYQMVQENGQKINNYLSITMPHLPEEQKINFEKGISAYEKYEQEGNTQKFYDEYMDKISDISSNQNPNPKPFVLSKNIFMENYKEFKNLIKIAENLKENFEKKIPNKNNISYKELKKDWDDLKSAMINIERQKQKCNFSAIYAHIHENIQNEINDLEEDIQDLKKFLFVNKPYNEEKPTIFYSIWEGGIDWDFFFQEELMNLFLQFHIFFPLFFILLSKFFKK